MRRSEALAKTLRLHAVVLHRISCLIEEGDHEEAEQRLDYMEALCKDTLETIQDLRKNSDFARSVESDLSALPIH